MAHHSTEKGQRQTADAGRNIVQVGGDYTQQTTFNFMFFLIGILALGGLAWGLYVAGFMQSPGGVEQHQPPIESSP